MHARIYAVNHRKRESGREIKRILFDRVPRCLRETIDSIVSIKKVEISTEPRVFARLNETRSDDWTRLYARNGSDAGKPNDLINFPTGPDSAGLPAGDFVPESPWRTGRSRKVGPATTETSLLPIICEMSVVVHTRLRERTTTLQPDQS